MIRDGKCIHFNGAANKTCKAGVMYSDVTIERPFGGLPCLEKNQLSGVCKKFQLPTPEEVEQAARAADEYIKAFLENMQIVRPAIVQHIEANGWEKRGIQSHIPCPICKIGTVNYTYAGNYNRHIHAQCTTDGCVGWME